MYYMATVFGILEVKECCSSNAVPVFLIPYPSTLYSSVFTSVIFQDMVKFHLFGGSSVDNFICFESPGGFEFEFSIAICTCPALFFDR